MKQIIVLMLFTVNSLFSFAPVISQNLLFSTSYPQGYFRNPLDIPIQLAANFGELRSNHFHMGLDIRTNHRENLAVHAAAEGYVSRIKIEKSGFGRAIYINHPNGYTTLYAHLNSFYEALQSYLIDKQYSDKKWEQDIEFEPGEFPVRKGQIIAYSGNTGGSAGPHLHFEIRDTKTGNNLNPWFFGFGLSDNMPPSIYRLYYYDRRYSTYQVSPVSIPITGNRGAYTSTQSMVVLSSPVVSFGISAEDKVHISSFKYGISEASLSVDGALQSDFIINDISYDTTSHDTRYVNGSIDYKVRASGGPYIQHLSQLPGNYSNIFAKAGSGKMVLTDTLIHNAEIVVKDAAGNSSVLRFKFKWDPSKTEELMFAANSFPMIPGQENQLKLDDIEADFSAKAFYDTVPFVHSSQMSNDPKIVSSVHHLHNYLVPVHDSFTVRIKPSVTLATEVKDRVIMQLISDHKVEAQKGAWKGEWMEAKFRDLGIVRLLIDSIPPLIRLTGWVNGGSLRNRKSISISASDNAGELKSFTALLDGNWLLFSRKDNTFTHTVDERTSPGRHELTVTVEDIAGNVTEKNFSFIR
jgi:hypothetical protein